MKKINMESGTKMIIGTGREIKSLYKTMVKKGFFAIFSDEPEVRKNGMYGLIYADNCDSFETGMMVINADTALALLYK